MAKVTQLYQEEDVSQSGWYTGFYYFAEHLKIISGGKINHKILYSLVGIEGRYINHDNPLVRKRTAGALSHIIHSKNYVDHMERRYSQNCCAFSDASTAIRDIVLECSNMSEGELLEYLMTACWKDVERGIINECSESRPRMDLIRAHEEIRMLFSAIRAESSECAQGLATEISLVIESILNILAFGHLDPIFLRSLAQETPLIPDTSGSNADIVSDLGVSNLTCLVKYPNFNDQTILDWWIVRPGCPFTVGRYTDCDAIDSSEAVSRMHCCIYCKDGTWYFEDMGSRFGCKVLDSGGSMLLDTNGNGRGSVVQLGYGYGIVLAGVSFYRFCSLGCIASRKIEPYVNF